MEKEEVRDYLKEQYPNLEGFIDQTLVAEMAMNFANMRLEAINCSQCCRELPTKDEIVAKVFTKVFRGEVDLRNVFRDEVNDAYYSGALDMHEELTK